MSYNTIHVHGAFAPEIALNGNLGTLVPFGLTMEETTLTPTAFFEDVKADASGAGISDIQFLGAECLIRMTLIRWDEGLLSSIRARLNGLTDGIIRGTASELCSARAATSWGCGCRRRSGAACPPNFPGHFRPSLWSATLR